VPQPQRILWYGISADPGVFELFSLGDGLTGYHALLNHARQDRRYVLSLHAASALNLRAGSRLTVLDRRDEARAARERAKALGAWDEDRHAWVSIDDARFKRPWFS
jgi:hypothetical protein